MQFAYISNVCVHPDYRGKHVGSMMLKYIIEICKKKYFDEIALDDIIDALINEDIARKLRGE